MPAIGRYHHARFHYHGDPFARVVPRADDLVKERCAKLLEARAREARSLKRGNLSGARYEHISVAIWENWFLEQDSLQGGNI